MEVFTASPRDRAQHRFVEQKTSFLQFLTVVEEVQVSLQDRVQQRFLLRNAFLSGYGAKRRFPVEIFMVFKVFSQDRVQQRFPSRCLLPQFMRLLLLSVSSWRLLPQFTLRLVLLVMMLHASSRTLMWRGWIIWAEWFITRGPA